MEVGILILKGAGRAAKSCTVRVKLYGQRGAAVVNKQAAGGGE